MLSPETNYIPTKSVVRTHLLNLAAHPGFEPELPESESGVLPLNERAMELYGIPDIDQPCQAARSRRLIPRCRTGDAYRPAGTTSPK